MDHATGHLAAAASLLALARVQRGQPASTAHLSLAQTAHWLLSAGTTTKQVQRDPDVSPYLVTLPGGDSAVKVVRPPGRVADLSPAGTFTSELGTPPRSLARYADLTFAGCTVSVAAASEGLGL